MTGKDVKRIRAKLGLSQSEFADLLAVPVRTLQQWEQDRQEPRSSAVSLLKLAEARKLK
jgi:putative transcriptional regulator